MPPDRHLIDAIAGEAPGHSEVQQLIEAERGFGTQGIRRSWQASDSNRVVLTSDASGVKISRDNGVTAPAQVVVDGTAAGGSLTGTYPNPTLSAATLDALLPPGTIVAYGGGTAPAGWLLCDGATVSRATYPKLWLAIGGTYGVGDGVTTFTLPNLVGRMVLGASALHPRGEVGGAETVAGPSHTHPGSHSHGLNGHSHGMSGHAHTSAGHDHGLPSHVHSGIVHSHSGAPMTISGSAAATGNTNGLYTAGSANAVTLAHTHAVSGSVAGNTADGGSGNTGGPGDYPSGPTTSTVTPGDTGGPTVADTGTPSPATTATDATANAASYPGTLAVMPPYQCATFIIRSGA